MRTRSLSAQHDAVVARRLELLTTELAAARERDPGATALVPVVTTWSGEEPAGIQGCLADGPSGTRDAGWPLPGGGDPDEPFQVAPGRGDGDSGARPILAPSAPGLPGRHASRRAASRSRWAAFLPEGLQGRVSLGAGHVAVVAVLAACGLAATCWWLLRSGGHEVAAPVAFGSSPAGLQTPGDLSQAGSGAGGGVGPVAPSAAPGSAATVVVDVTGRVRRPGIAVLRSGARVVDALRAAGGPRPGADLGALNLARVLTDGEQIVVGSPGGAPSAPTGGPGGVPTGAPGGALVDLNTADATALETLPEVGPVTAQSILTWRSEHGGFTSVDQLLDVDGIGDATLARLKPLVTV